LQISVVTPANGGRRRHCTGMGVAGRYLCISPRWRRRLALGVAAPTDNAAILLDAARV
jgi:hypothetical protein